jgi:hypothetical protein
MNEGPRRVGRHEILREIGRTGSQPVGTPIGLTVSAGLPPAPVVTAPLSYTIDGQNATLTVDFTEADPSATVWCEVEDLSQTAEEPPVACISPWTSPVLTLDPDSDGCSASGTLVL